MNPSNVPRALLVCTSVLLLAASAYGQSWSPARLLSDPTHTGDIKEPKLAPAWGGGFHSMYRHFPSGAVTVNYRGFQNGSLLPTVEVHRLGFLAGGDICEAGDGSIHIVWENWDDVNEQIWWAKSSNGGVSFPSKQAISSYGTNPNGQAKNPMVIPFGGSNSAEVMALSWGAPPVNALYYNRYNGSSFLGHTPVGQSTANSYAAWGCARDPRDGSVFRSYGIQVGGVWQIAYRRFNGSTWEPQVLVSEHTNDFASRPAMAINQAGQLMVVWDKDTAVWSRVRDPITGWGPVLRVDDGYTPSITAIPGKNEFYLAHPYPKDTWNHIAGRKWANGAWGPRTRVSNGIADDYSPNCDVTADDQGHIYCAWEYWAEAVGKPRAWFSVLSNTPPAALTSPTNLQGFLAPATILLEAKNLDAAASLTRVEFLQGSNTLGARTAPPFSLSVPNLDEGSYSFRVVASNTLGAFGTSAPVNVVVAGGMNTTLVETGSAWKYYTNGTDLGTAWRGSNFNDIGWPSGPAQLGFGDGDEATTIDNNRARITTYFRRSFNVPFARAVKALTIRILRDDGAAVYLNGVEVLRNNLPESAGSQTSAIAAIGGADETNWLTYAANPGLLVPGTNVLAVEIHQAGTNSSDLSFDLELTGIRANPTPPRVNFSAPSPLEAYLAPGAFLLSATADDDDGDVQRVEFFVADAVLGSDNTVPFSTLVSNLPAGEYIFTARAVDSNALVSAGATLKIPVVAGAATTLVARKSAWKYRDNGVDPGPTWAARTYNDSAWSSGTAELGYGDGDESTLVSFGTNGAAKHITTWFRQTFTVSDTRDIRGLTLRLLRDDGAIVYLNGAEVLRSNMPEGPVTATTPAIAAIGGLDETVFHTAYIDAGLLVNGGNVLAVRVHQSSGSSTDLSFDAELTALEAAPPVLRVDAVSTSMELSWPSSVSGYTPMFATNLASPITWFPLATNILNRSGQSTIVITNRLPSGFYKLQRD